MYIGVLLFRETTILRVDLLVLHRAYKDYIGIDWDYIGKMQNKMETKWKLLYKLIKGSYRCYFLRVLNVLEITH